MQVSSLTLSSQDRAGETQGLAPGQHWRHYTHIVTLTILTCAPGEQTSETILVRNPYETEPSLSLMHLLTHYVSWWCSEYIHPCGPGVGRVIAAMSTYRPSPPAPVPSRSSDRVTSSPSHCPQLSWPALSRPDLSPRKSPLVSAGN